MSLASPEKDPLEPLWNKATQAGNAGDFPGLIFAWRALVEHGVMQVCAHIGQLYERGAEGGAEGVEKDINQALFWYHKAVFECDDPLAHLGLGRAYYNGVGEVKNIEQARKHFEAAHSYGLPQARIYLGVMYYFGNGVERDVELAKKYLESAAAEGFAYAYLLLARFALHEGKLFKAISTAVKGCLLIKKIADKDHMDPRLLGIGIPLKKQ